MSNHMFDSAPAFEVKSNQSKGLTYAEQAEKVTSTIDRRAEASARDSGSRR